MKAPLVRYSELLNRLKMLFVEALKTEEDTTNRQLLMWTGAAFAFENMSDYPDVRDFAPNFLNLLLSKLLSGAWPLDDAAVALLVVAQMAKTVPNILTVSKETPPQVLNSLCKIVEVSMLAETKGAKVTDVPPLELLVIRAFGALSEWIMSDSKSQWLMFNTPALKGVLEVLELAITGERVRSFACRSDVMNSLFLNMIQRRKRHKNLMNCKRQRLYLCLRIKNIMVLPIRSVKSPTALWFI